MKNVFLYVQERKSDGSKTFSVWYSREEADKHINEYKSNFMKDDYPYWDAVYEHVVQGKK